MKSADEIILSVLPRATVTQRAAIERFLEASHDVAVGRRRALVGVLAMCAGVWGLGQFVTAASGEATPELDASVGDMMRWMLAATMVLSLILYALLDVRLYFARQALAHARLPADAAGKVLAMARAVRMAVYFGSAATRLLSKLGVARRR
jgi:hypothetical protein